MYKYRLCLRYLRTRYLAIVCIVSIMLGVATLIVVNSVMSGFSKKMRDRFLGTSADLTVGTQYFAGLDQPDQLAKYIQEQPAGRHIAAVAPSVEVIGTVQFTINGQNVVKPVKVMGIDPARQVKVGKFSEYLVNQKQREVPSFELTPPALGRFNALRQQALAEEAFLQPLPVASEGSFLADRRPGDPQIPPPPLPDPNLPPIEPPKPIGIIVGDMIAHLHYKDAQGQVTVKTMLEIGDTVMLATLSADEMRPVWSHYVVVDYFKSEMSEYDAQFVYLPLPELQRLRHMQDRVTSLQMKLTNDTPKRYQFVKQQVAFPIEKALGAPQSGLWVMTWEDQQGPILAAIDIERGILNLLLFMIVGVAGFSILAIFTMIVSEKYRDIGILKSLGASNRGVMGIFVWYAIFLGVVGCGLGSAAGLTITHYINEIETWITSVTGQQLFDRSVYYFDKIPTNVEEMTVALVNTGAMIVAVISSLVPAVRAARLQPIQALRFE